MGAGCENPNPLETVEPIGEYPTWGEGFAEEPVQAEDSLLGVAPTAAAAVDLSDVSAAKGNAAEGKTLYTNLCARCHGPAAAGMQLPMIGAVPSLVDDAVKAKPDAELAGTIWNGRKNMPAFQGQLDPTQLSHVLAHVRALQGSGG